MIPDIETTETSAPMLERITNHAGRLNDKILVMASSHHDAQDWARSFGFNRSEFFSITSPMQLRGVQTGHYPRVRTKRFFENPNALAINRELVARDEATRTPSWR